jgi:hypothetical protein
MGIETTRAELQEPVLDAIKTLKQAGIDCVQVYVNLYVVLHGISDPFAICSYTITDGKGNQATATTLEDAVQFLISQNEIIDILPEDKP